MGEVSNTDRLVTMQRSAGKPWVLALMSGLGFPGSDLFWHSMGTTTSALPFAFSMGPF